jgi:hypothetical protein
MSGVRWGPDWARRAPPWARWAAFGVALLAILDPAIQNERRQDAIVAVVAVTEADAVLSREVAQTLSSVFTVVEGPFLGAAATVVVGDGIPANGSALAAPVFAVNPAPRRARIDEIVVPAVAAVGTRIPVQARWRAADARRLHLELREGGALLDRVPLVAEGGDQASGEGLLFDLPTAPGVRRLELRVVEGEGSSARTVAEGWTLYEAVERPVPVLFHDPRPIWGSTFLRRALEQDLRFRVSARVRTSPGFASTWGTPPAALTDPGALEPWDLMVLGGAESLSAGEVAAVAQHLRVQGGVVLLLLDTGEGGPWTALVPGASGWRSRGGETTAPSDLVWTAPELEGVAPFRASRVIYPERLPPRARSLAVAPGDIPALWELPVGLGTLVVSGAVDVWQFRDPEDGAFEAAWRGVAGWAASRVAPAVEIRPDVRVATPGARVPVTVTLRRGDGQIRIEGVFEGGDTDGALGDGEGEPEATAFRLWPGSLPGRFHGVIPLPAGEGSGVIRVRGELDGLPFEADAPLHRMAGSSGQGGIGPESHPQIRTLWIEAQGGEVTEATALATLPSRLEAAVGGARQVERRHPMRSPWWIVPFALLLALEWGWRRRRGLP